MSKSAKVQLKVDCAECGGGPRNHNILREYEVHWENEEYGVQGETSYQIIQCVGCDSVRFRTVSWSSEDYNPITNLPEPTIRVYPERIQIERQIHDAHALPTKVSRIYAETVSAYTCGALILAGGGLRAIVEAICIEQNVKGRNLQEKIDALVLKGLLAKPQAELLHEERYIGNAALHEILPPSREDIEDGLLIVEGLLTTIYTLPDRARRLRQKRQSKK